MKEPGTSLCLVTMNRAGVLRQSIEAIKAHAVQPYEIIVVDNGSTDSDALSYLEELEDRGLSVIRNPTNQGLSVATNQGFAAARHETLIHMDDDALVTLPGWNQVLANFLTDHLEVGAVAPDRGHAGTIAHPDFTEVRWFLGMLWATRASLVAEIGGYDPQLIHQQECDFALRVRMHGLLAVQCPGLPAAAVIHNDPAPQSELSIAREDMGTVGFHDKWCEYFRGRATNYGTTPRYLMQHFPSDQEFFFRLAVPLGLNEAVEELVVGGQHYWVARDIRPDNAFAEPIGAGHHEALRTEIIARWLALTGEVYKGYSWGRIPYGLTDQAS